MIGQTVNFQINILGNAKKAVGDIDSQVQKLTNSAKSCKSVFERLLNNSFTLNQVFQSFQNVSSALDLLSEPGVKLNSSLADLSAITGQTGSGLADIEKRARSLAKTYGNSAAQSVESFKLILSQLSPDIANNSEALQKMGESVAVLSKSMGGDSVAATNVPIHWFQK